jgi:NADPH-dependent curcumin reductase CurA
VIGGAENRAWTLASRPQGRVSVETFAMTTSPLTAPDLAAGEILVRNRLFAVAPTLRNSLNPPGRAYRGSIAVGGTIVGMAGAEILASRHPDFRPGDRLVALSRWEDFSVLAPDRAPVPVFPVPPSMGLDEALGPLSPNSLTAYFGLIEVGRPRSGETVVVSAAAGSVGSVACQIARILGCRVVAIAGGAGKCAWLKDVCRVDDTIDYKSENVAARLAALCPASVDLYFDNVGGEILQAVIDNIAPRGRVVLCGQISAYDSGAPAPGPRDMMKLVYGRVRMEGFVVGDYVDRVEAARDQIRRWIVRGDMVVRTDLRRGFERLPQAFTDLFAGANAGTLLVEA